MRIVEIDIDGRRWRLAVADTWRTRMRGLAGRDRLEAGHGMLFRFPLAWRWPIHMRGMRFAIQAIWLYRGRIIDRHVLPIGTRRWWRPRQKADALIEIPD